SPLHCSLSVRVGVHDLRLGVSGRRGRHPACPQVIVDHPGRLHQRVSGRRTDEAEPAALQFACHSGGFRRRSGDLSDGRGPRSLRRRERPQQLREVDLSVRGSPRIGDGRLDLGAVTDDALVGHQAGHVGVGEAGDLLDVEAGEGVPEILPFAQDDQPGQAALECLQTHPFEQRHPPVQWLAPLLVVVVAVQQEVRAVGPPNRPVAADQAVVGRGHVCSGSSSTSAACRSSSAAISAAATACTDDSWPRSWSSSWPSRSSTQSTSLVLYPRRVWVNLTASTSAPVTPDAGNTVGVVPRGSGGSGSPRPNSRLATPNSTTATRTKTTTYSNTNATASILPYGCD